MHAPDPTLLARLQRLVLTSELFNFSFNFVTALMATLLMSRGLWSPREASLVLAGATLISSLILPWVGRAIDRSAFALPLAFALVGNVLGVLGVTSPTGGLVTFLSAALIILSTGTINTMTTHVLEGLTPTAERRRLATWNYVITNLGYAISGLIAWALLKDYRTILIGFDVLTHVLICGTLYYASRRLAMNARGPKPASAPWREIVTPRILAAMGCVLILGVMMFSHFSVLQVLYRDLGLDPATYAAACFAIGSITVVALGPWVPRLGLPLEVRVFGGTVLMALGFSLQPLIHSMTINAVLTVLWSVGEVLIVGELSQAFFLNTPVEHAGAISGLRSFTLKFAAVLCPLISVVFRPTSVAAFSAIFGVPSIFAGFGLYLVVRRAERAAV